MGGFMANLFDIQPTGAATPQIPKLHERKPFHIPQFDAMPKPKMACVNCQRSLKNEAEFLQLISVCRECLRVHNLIDSALNAAAEQKSISTTRQRFLGKLKA